MSYATVPFHLKRSKDTYSATEFTTTTERIHGLVRLEGDQVVIQWRLSRETERMGATFETETEHEAVREVSLPLSAVSGAVVRTRGWNRVAGPRLALRAADLRAFEAVTGSEGLKLAHPAEIVLRLRRGDVLVAQEFAAELTLAVAESARHRIAPPEEESP